MVPYYMGNHGDSIANICRKSRLLEGMYLLDPKPAHAGPRAWLLGDSREL